VVVSRESAALALRLVSGTSPDTDLIDVMMSLFDGHDIPAMWWDRPNRWPGFYPAHGVNRQLAVEAHLMGAVTAGVYPFKGVTPWCRCDRRAHVCAGLGTRYLCIDLDAKNGETDIEARTRRVLAVCWRLGLLPVVFSSRSGNGSHIYLFLSRAISTREAFDAGKAIAALSDITDRCDVIPSAEHRTGLGTLHALPLGSQAAAGGGNLYDSNLRPVPRAHVVSTLRWADQVRTPAGAVESLARGELDDIIVDAAISQDGVAIIRRGSAQRELRYSRATPLLSKRDERVLKAMRNKHPQFRQALATPAHKWVGRRSSRDAYLVNYMRRQGISAAGVVRALIDLPGTKAAERGEDYAWALIESQTQDELVFPHLAGQRLRPAAAKKQRAEAAWAPWDARLAPPLRYGDTLSPWWRTDVQAKLQDHRSKADAIVLAYLVDRYYRGPICRRMFFCGQRTLGKALDMPARSAGRTAARVSERFPEVLRVVNGVPHPTLRIARGYYVPERRHRDRLDWNLEPVRYEQGMLVCSHDPGCASGDCGHRPQHATARLGGALPY
jgi:hypothetical protein